MTLKLTPSPQAVTFMENALKLSSSAGSYQGAVTRDGTVSFGAAMLDVSVDL